MCCRPAGHIIAGPRGGILSLCKRAELQHAASKESSCASGQSQ